MIGHSLRFTFIILFCFKLLPSILCTPLLLPLTYSYFSTPNYRIGPMAPINSLPANCWMAVYTSLPSGWNQLSTSSVLSYTGNGTKGISINFLVGQPGMYTIELVFNASLVSQTTISLWFNGSSIATSQINQINQFNFARNFSALNSTMYIWTENSVNLNSIRIYTTIKNIPVYVSLRAYPAQKLLLLITNISTTNMTNTLLFEQSTLLLAYRQGLNSSCLLSQGAPTNPADFANYDSSTNFSSLSSSYTFSVVAPSSPMMAGIPAGLLVLSVANVLVDCTVDVIVNLADGIAFNDGYWATFNSAVNQTVTYIEEYL